MSKPGVVIFRDGFDGTLGDRVECDHIDVKAGKDDIYARVDGEAWRWHWSDVKEVARPLDGGDGQ